MKILLFLLSLIWAMPAWAAGPTLYKEFSYGQPRAEILQLPGVQACDEVEKGALCRSRQAFAGYDGWQQAFLFSGDKLAVVALAGPTSETLYTSLFGVMHNNEFFTVVLQSDDKVFDFARAIHERGFDAAAGELAQFEVEALNSSESLTYTLLPKDALKAAGKAGSYPLYARQAPTSLRATEIVVRGDTLAVRFLAPAAALRDMQERMDSQKESF